MKSVKRKCNRATCKHSAPRKNKRTHHKNKRTHHKRLRSQRGGSLEAEYDQVIAKYMRCTDLEVELSIQKFFNNCEIFKKLLKLRNEQRPPLKQVVCGNEFIKLTDAQIRSVEFAFILPVSNQFPSIKPKLETTWPEFVLHLKKVVEAGYQKKTDTEIDARLRALKGFAPTSAITTKKESPLPKSVEVFTPVQATTRQPLPEGWTQSGTENAPIYFNKYGASTYERPTAPATPTTAPVASSEELVARLAAALEDD